MAVVPHVDIGRTPAGYRIAPETRVTSGVRVRGDHRLVVGRGTRIDGGVFAGGTVHCQPNVTVHGPIRAFGRVVLGAHARIGGDVEARGDVRLLPGGVVLGSIEAHGDVHLFHGAEVRGTVRAGGDIVVWGHAATHSLRPGGRVRSEPFPESMPQPGSGPDVPRRDDA